MGIFTNLERLKRNRLFLIGLMIFNCVILFRTIQKPAENKPLHSSNINRVSANNHIETKYVKGNDRNIDLLKPSFGDDKVNSQEQIKDVRKRPKVAPDCIGDCLEIKKFVRSWPKDRIKAMIYILIAKKSLFHEDRLKAILQQLDMNFNEYYQYPIIIFHESYYGDSERKLIRDMTTSEVFFHVVNFTVPGFLTDPIPKVTNCSAQPIGYRSMCRFNAIEIYKLPIMSMFDYAWRLDDDSKITEEITYDVFELMKRKRLLYGYALPSYESARCAIGLKEFVVDFYNQNKDDKKIDVTLKRLGMSLQPPTYFNNFRQAIYYNNFEISHRSVFMNPVYSKFADLLDHNGGIFYRRWGDAPIKTLAVNMMVPQDKIHHFCDIEYSHHGRKTNCSDPFHSRQSIKRQPLTTTSSNRLI